MLYVFTGTDRKKARAEMSKAIAAAAQKTGARVVRIGDMQGVSDVHEALSGGGLFEESRVVVFDGVMIEEGVRELLLSHLEVMDVSKEQFFIFEEKVDAKLKRTLEKYTKKIFQFDAIKQKDSGSIFTLARALERADKKALWIGLEREIALGVAPEAIHGVLFWGAKQALLSTRSGSAEAVRGNKFVAELAELPHLARRGNMPLEYALLRFALSVA